MDLKVIELRKAFHAQSGDVQAVHGVSFEVPRGTFFTLLGPSGSGKTTILRCIGGLEMPDSGEISLGEKIYYSDRRRIGLMPEERGIGMVFQSYAIWPHMTVFQNVAYPLAKEASRGEIKERVGMILGRLSLGSLADRLAPNLSGGQQQRVALARALVARPQVLLLDEPLSNLDAKLREQMRFELKALQESLGITTVYVTHDQEEALALSDRIGLMHEGALLEVGAPAELYLRPAHRVTADFLGTANFVAARVERNADRPWDEMVLETPIGKFVAQRSVEWQPGVATQLFFRPECVDLLDANAPPNDGPNYGEGVVERVTFLGNSADMIMRCKDTQIRVRSHPTRTPAAGRQVRFFIAPESCIVFPDPAG